MTCGGTGALPDGGPDASGTWRRQILPAQAVGLEPRAMWRLWSLLLLSDGLGASGHVATPEPSPVRWCTWCLRARGNTGALSWLVACSAPRGT
jgi:hypothetical protein